MAIIGSLSPTLAVAFKAIPTLENDTDTIQVGGSIDGVFHGSDATPDNTKPIRMDDLGSGYFAQGVSLRGQDGQQLGLPSQPVRVDPVGTTAQPQVVKSVIMDENGNLCPIAVQVLNFEPATIGNNVVLGALSGFKIRVMGFWVSASIAANVYFINTTGSQVSGKIYNLGATIPFFQASTPDGGFLFETSPGEGLTLVSSSVANLSINVIWAQVPA